MKLYAAAGASAWTARPRLAVLARGLPVEICPVPGGAVTSPEYLAITPLGKVPALVLDDGTVIVESEVIVEYLEDRFAQAPLRPALPEERARARMIARMCDLYLLEAGRPLLGQLDPATRDQAIVEQALDAVDQALAHINHFMGAGPYAVGKTLSTADCALVTSLAVVHGFATYLGRTDLLKRHGKIAAYMAFVVTNPHVARVLNEMHEAIATRVAKQ